ncbi:hypothetical protein BACCAP_00554 [Pseudoflavonifractor capillosus ATCC 29799]|uniref:Uncharacterized protein n=1 Tax=Pseudoflavonifractor capillosus ATCC 29799 TaxID=411467 RepID=A6NQT3_9FIRM|nr:hypothetical protein BACCAP_00554 [Pseudoflavonifractor capillosus ATCC 29799]
MSGLGKTRSGQAQGRRNNFADLKHIMQMHSGDVNMYSEK